MNDATILEFVVRRVAAKGNYVPRAYSEGCHIIELHNVSIFQCFIAICPCLYFRLSGHNLNA